VETVAVDFACAEALEVRRKIWLGYCELGYSSTGRGLIQRVEYRSR